MPVKKLTVRTCEAAPVGVTWDTEIKGFGLRHNSGGRKTFIMKYRFNKRQRMVDMKSDTGAAWTFPAVPVEQARSKAQEWSTALQNGKDPNGGAPSEIHTVADLAKKYEEEHIPHLRDAEKEAARLHRHILPQWGHWALPAVTRAEVKKWHASFVKTDDDGKEGGHYEGDHCVILLGSMYNFARDEHKYTGENPARITGKRHGKGISLHRPPHKSIRHHQWTQPHKQAVLDAVDGYMAIHAKPKMTDKHGKPIDHRPITRTRERFGKTETIQVYGGQIPPVSSLLALRFHYYTPRRSSEVMTLCWAVPPVVNKKQPPYGLVVDKDGEPIKRLEDAVAIQWEHHKTDNDGKHVIAMPINSAIRAVLTDAWRTRIVGNPYVFHNGKKGYVKSLNRMWRTIRTRADIQHKGIPARIHDFRHKYGDELVSLGFTRVEIKLAMDHKTDAASARYAQGDDTHKRAIYDRMAKG